MYVCMYLFVTSCNDNLVLDILADESFEETCQAITIEVPNVLKFESEKHFQNVLGQIKEEVPISDLRSEKLLSKINFQDHSPSLSLRAAAKEFISLLDTKYENDLAHLTAADWNIINLDPENLVYEPEDGIISDTYLASLVNSNREIQIDTQIFQFTDNGIYTVAVSDYSLLSNPISLNNDPRITVYTPPTTVSSSSNPVLSGSLKLGNGVIIPASNIKELNFKDRGDANMITNFWTSLWGSHTVAIQNFSSSRKMVVNFYEQDYLIYKNIGTKTKMQKKVLGIWWNCDAQEIRVGWEAIELKESYPTFPFTTAPKPNFTQNLYPNMRIDEKQVPAWLSKNFPFKDNYTLFTIPFASYDISTKDVNAVYKSAISIGDKAIKAWMKSENKSNPPAEFGFIGLEKEGLVRYVIGPNEEGRTKRGSFEKKFLSEWFGGTYIIGYATDPNSPNFQTSKFQYTIKGNGTRLGRGSIYGAVKYDGKWLAARILKSE